MIIILFVCCVLSPGRIYLTRLTDFCWTIALWVIGLIRSYPSVIRTIIRLFTSSGCRLGWVLVLIFSVTLLCHTIPHPSWSEGTSESLITFVAHELSDHFGRNLLDKVQKRQSVWCHIAPLLLWFCWQDMFQFRLRSNPWDKQVKSYFSFTFQEPKALFYLQPLLAHTWPHISHLTHCKSWSWVELHSPSFFSCSITKIIWLLLRFMSGKIHMTKPFFCEHSRKLQWIIEDRINLDYLGNVLMIDDFPKLRSIMHWAEPGQEAHIDLMKQCWGLWGMWWGYQLHVSLWKAFCSFYSHCKGWL